MVWCLKASFYVDDASFHLKPNTLSLETLILELDCFSSIKMEANKGKCCLLRIGSLKAKNFKILCRALIKWSNGPVSLLEIHIPAGETLLGKINSNFIPKEVDIILQAWRGKHLTIYDKVAIINSLIVHRLHIVYFLHLLLMLLF